MDQVDIKVSPDLIQGIVERKVQTAITEALSNEKCLVERVVTAALEMKVRQDGKVSRYSSDNKFTYLEALCNQLIRDAAKTAIKEWAEGRKQELKAEFLRQLQTKKTSKILVRACVDGIVNAVGNKWMFSVNVRESGD